jgi:leader peptidase (prepilin peptidase)/N-methyltransferase
MVPRSRCPHCGHQITALENIPVIQLAHTQRPLQKLQKPDQPSLSVGGTGHRPALAASFLMLGPEKALFAIPMTWALISLTMIDFDTQLAAR